MSVQSLEEKWHDLLSLMRKKCNPVEYRNWWSPVEIDPEKEVPTLLVPNVFVSEYLLHHYREELGQHFGITRKGKPAISFSVRERVCPKPKSSPPPRRSGSSVGPVPFGQEVMLNKGYTFDNFIEGPSNRFIKSACIGVASGSGCSYNPLLIHGGVGLGKTHLLHGIGHALRERPERIGFQCITTEGFINQLISHLREKSIDKMKRYFRNLDVLLVDDIQFLENRPNFEDEFCNTFETLINQNKQIVITSDKPPGQLKLSERMVARMECGLVAHIGMPDLETRVAILQHKAEQRGFTLSQKVAFYIADHLFNNVRQMEGVINRLGAQRSLMDREMTEGVIDDALGDLLRPGNRSRISIDRILTTVALAFDVSEQDLCGPKRARKILTARQIAMYLAKELLNESLSKTASAFGGKTHSTLLHAWKKISLALKNDDKLRRRVQKTRQNIEA
ncbi:MAG: chromosomal replication initiator protein DnaA [Simkaniaceae bacterium]|nr:chromosomal replication initiator protein DnaA [Simkaniaceae bacterium]